jgi:hypothetical protein
MDVTDAAIAACDANANQAWKDRMYGFVEEVCLTMKRFTADDVFELAVARRMTETTSDNRAFGAVMRRAAKAGICTKADAAAIPSRRELHRSPLQPWDSNVVMQAAA